MRSEVSIAAPPESVWRIISDLDGEPRYWKGTTSVRNVSSSGNTVTREITIAFRGKKCMQVVTLHPMECVEAVFTEGVLRGTKTLSIRVAGAGTTVLEAEWDVSLGGTMGMFAGAIRRHIKSGTGLALEAIKAEAEGGGQGTAGAGGGGQAKERGGSPSPGPSAGAGTGAEGGGQGTADRAPC